MCGITGFAERNHKAETARRIVKGMADLITYRGPDGEGYYVDDQVALGHRRLSIIDLEGGKQPMFNEDGSLVCIFNGEIYNFQTLREELIAAGHTFATRSDTEVLLHGYEQWGNQLPGKLRGMFTFVIWDQKTKTMFGARDIFGIKPFYYYNQDGLFLFGSEIKSFLAHPGFKKELNEERLPEYLSIEYIPNEETMFKNVYKLPSGCMFTWENGELTVERYYEIKYHVDDSKSLEEWEKIITDTFAESVAAHQIADVEVGCFLSSGVDSSFVVNEVAKGTPHVKSFSVGYAEEKYSELPYAQEFSKEIGVPSIANKVDAEQFFEANRLMNLCPTRRKFRFTFWPRTPASTSRSCFPAKVPMNCLAATPCTARRFTLWITSIRCPKRCGRPQAQWHPNCRTLRASTSWCAVPRNPGSAICAPTMFSWTRLNVTAA